MPTFVAVTCAAAAACSDPEPAPNYAYLATGQAAQVVIGQADFTSNLANRGGSRAADTLAYPHGNPAVVDGHLYVSDGMNYRVLTYPGVPEANGAAATLVLGAPDMTSTAPGQSDSSFNRPGDVSSSAGKLVLADANNGRVLVWNTVPASTNVPADVVVGNPSMTVRSTACNATDTAGVIGAFTAGGRLIVADEAHNRVLVWNAIPTTNGRAADLVLGQPDFTTCTDPWPSPPSRSTFSHPRSVWSDGTRLLVVEGGRVVIWHAFPTASAQQPDRVIGQPDYSSSCGQTSAACLTSPMAVTSNGTQIAVADWLDNRVLVWNTFPMADGAPADVVLGQQDFASDGSGASATRLLQPQGVLFFQDALLVSDEGNSRVLVFR